MVYVFIIIATTLLAAAGDRVKGVAKGVFVLLMLLVPCVFAGCRDYSVGVDVMVYGFYTFADASWRPYLDFMQSFYGRVTGVGFATYAWLVSQFDNAAVYFGFLQFAAFAPYYFGARRLGTTHSWPAVLCYMLFLFPLSLCLMRQVIAISIVFLFLKDCIDGKLTKYVFGILVAMLFHNTAVLTLALYPLYREISLLEQGRAFFGRASVMVIAIMCFLAFILIGIFWEQIVPLFSSIKESYNITSINYDSASFSWSALVLLVPSLICCYLLRARGNNLIQEGERSGGLDALTVERFCLLLMLVGFVCFELGVFASALSRFSYYFLGFGGILCSVYLDEKPFQTRNPSFLLMASAYTLYFCITILYQNIGGVMPYSSAILGIG